MAWRFLASIVFGLLMAGAAQADPQTDYMLKCMGCHGPDGAEVVGKVPALKDSVARFFLVEGGRAYIVQVPGARQSPLPDIAMAELLNWLGPRFDAAHMPEYFMPYSGAEVHELRKTRLADVSAIRKRLIALIDENEASKK